MACTLVFGGDIAPIRESHDGMFGTLEPVIGEADLAVANLEIALSDKGTRARGKEIAERGSPAGIAALSCFDALNLANNHVLDFGEPALLDTMAGLARCGIPFFGAGHDAAGAARPVILERQGIKIGLLGYTSTLPEGFAAAADAPGVNPLRAHTSYRMRRDPEAYPGTAPIVETRTHAEDLERMKTHIRDLKRVTDVVLVYQHWGASMTEAVLDFQREIGHAAIDAGAAGVFGGHQHVISAIEFHKGAPIVHGMGNLLFDIKVPFLTEVTHRTFLFRATVAGSGLQDCELVCARAGVVGRYDPATRLAPASDEGRMIVEALRRTSAPFRTRLDVLDDRIRVRPAD